MKKTVNLFYFLAMFLVISCFSGTEPESEPETELKTEALTLADRAGVYTGVLIDKKTGKPTGTKAMLVLHADGTGAYAVTSLIQLIVGSHESTGVVFNALKVVPNVKPQFAAEITFDLNDPNKVVYDTNPADKEIELKIADTAIKSFDPTAVILTKK